MRVWVFVEKAFQAISVKVEDNALLCDVIGEAQKKENLEDIANSNFQAYASKSDVEAMRLDMSVKDVLKVCGYDMNHPVVVKYGNAGLPQKRQRVESSDEQQITKLMKDLKECKVEDGFLNLNTSIPWLPKGTPQQIYIRQAYKEINEEIEKLGETPIVIVGNSGIGKSLFAVYKLYLALKAGKKVVLHHQFSSTNYIFSADGAYIAEDSDARSFLSNSELNADYYFDCCTKQHTPCLRSNVIMFSSPHRLNYADVEKMDKSKVIYMPVWSKEEIDCVHSRVGAFREVAKETVHSNFDVFGGIPRYVFRDDQSLISRLEIYCSTVTRDLLIELGTHQSTEEHSHFVLQLRVATNPDGSFNYYSYTLDFASDFVTRKVHDALQRRDRDECLRFVRMSADVPPIASLRGRIFEIEAHKILQKGGVFVVRKLQPKYSRTAAKTQQIYIDKSNERVFRSIHQMCDDMYMKPISKTFCAIDALIPPDKAFQMTVSTSHDIKSLGINLVAPRMRNPMKFYFVVPEDIFDSYQNEHTIKGQLDMGVAIEQYALCIELQKV